jgi:hypothetical protein
VAVALIHCTCDWCEAEESFDEAGDEFEAGWIVAKLPPDGRNVAYCSPECAVSDLE